MLDKIYALEKKVLNHLNSKGWDLVHTGEGTLPYDAKGKTPKGFDCVIEMKFRDKYYDTKLLELAKYRKLMKLDSDIQKFYFVSDPNGGYMFWLNKMKDFQESTLYCPQKTFWNSKKQNKNIFLLKEEQAIAKFEHYATY
jgi:hypothetical protein